MGDKVITTKENTKKAEKILAKMIKEIKEEENKKKKKQRKAH